MIALLLGSVRMSCLPLAFAPAPALYDVVQDPGESKDLSAAQPEKVKELRTLWDKWDAEQAPPAAAADANRPAGKKKKGQEKAKPPSEDD